MGKVIYTDDQIEVENIITHAGGRVVVDFSAPAWCGPCQKFAPHFERAAEEADDITFVAVDVDNADWALLDFGVRSVPTVLLYENGTHVRDVKAPQGALPFLRDIRS